MIQLQGVDVCSTDWKYTSDIVVDVPGFHVSASPQGSCQHHFHCTEAVPNSKTQDRHIYNFELLFEASSKIMSRKSSILLQKISFSNRSPDVLEEDLNVVSRIFIHSGEIV